MPEMETGWKMEGKPYKLQVQVDQMTRDENANIIWNSI